MRQFKVLLIVVALSYPMSAFALSEDHHEQITTSAMSHYKQCQAFFPGQLKAISAANASVIAAASGDIDRISLLHLRRVLSRAWNWHFYDAGLTDAVNPHASLKPTWAHMNRSLHRIFVEKVILAGQRRDLADEDFFILSGEVIHFVQDMAVPAHVAPIYHAMSNRDDFDYYSVEGLFEGKEPATKKAMEESKNQCRAFIQANESPEKILIHLAENTRAAIAESIDDRSNRRWTVLWNLPPKGADVCQDGFCSYGICGNVFDQAKHRMISLPQACQIEPKTTNAFYEQRYEKMLQASLQVLIFLNRKSLFEGGS